MNTHTVALQNFPLGHNILPQCKFYSSQATSASVMLSSLPTVLHFTNPHRPRCLKMYGAAGRMRAQSSGEEWLYSWLHKMAFNNLFTYQVCAFALPLTFVA